jgi:hypothetical protein
VPEREDFTGLRGNSFSSQSSSRTQSIFPLLGGRRLSSPICQGYPLSTPIPKAERRLDNQFLRRIRLFVTLDRKFAAGMIEGRGVLVDVGRPLDDVKVGPSGLLLSLPFFPDVSISTWSLETAWDKSSLVSAGTRDERRCAVV